ncbi:hypothetical protein RO3G_07042 [Rhizopus delemar RA 99-880]|uniref:Uncharacterized protein n=1 Tax=Rhizopus delemar (strain RA 99-880 / ATCC MYA-4621 / FGSC 9543 / NRRL 43880) TaxID=246409 RepID=I1C1K7_RHIO9|nr:hypothetical protein RO3G_07042 [Rhizopus delemar RA 99-880]|eukprot:EIE82337.1 hypothetical protein RO3G_07042 [Rhizopus delemar RA 99-880]
MISTKERKLMSRGSSLILDISDKSESNIYKSLFSMIDWNKILLTFENNLVLPKGEIDENMLAKWDYATGLAMISNDIEDSQIYFASQFATSISKKQRSTIKLFIAILDVFQNNAFIMEQKHPDNISEGDYIDQIWLPVLKSLFAIHGHLIQVKKVDVRLIYDHGASEFDIGVAEACLPEVDDSAKLLREGKDNTDTLIKVTCGDAHNSWIMQISGPMAFLRDNVENFAQMAKARNFQANKSNTNISTKYHDSGFTTPPHIQQPSCQKRYTPPRKQQKRSVFPDANYELLETDKYAVVDDDTDANSPDDDDSENAKEDAFGFVKLMNGWYLL